MRTGTIDAWWLGLAALINTHDRIELPDLNCRFECADQATKKRAYIAITERIHSDYDVLPAVKAAISAAGIDSGALAQREALSNEQLRRLAASPLVTIGAHGERHINLARVSVAEAHQEMISSRRLPWSILLTATSCISPIRSETPMLADFGKRSSPGRLDFVLRRQHGTVLCSRSIAIIPSLCPASRCAPTKRPLHCAARLPASTARCTRASAIRSQVCEAAREPWGAVDELWPCPAFSP